MVISETQRLGALVLLAVSLAIYTASQFHTRQHVQEPSLPWGVQGPGLIAVEIATDQAKSGIYFVPEGAGVDMVRQIAEFPETGNRVQIKGIRLSAGSLISVSPQGEVQIGQMAASKKLALGLPLDLNLASEQDLTLIPGIGDKMASQIILLRNQKGTFQDLTDLTAVPGIKEKKLEGLKSYLMVRRSLGKI
ncbi:MAG: helix-hairpin-helix domain-containing protein [Syntrophales bacterium]|nr:helix-hairpin-helix domain-containing protein [Syntrophales bacterium]